MRFESIDRNPTSDTEEFEKLEFLPEPAEDIDSESEQPLPDIQFIPESGQPPEPPVSFNLNDAAPEPQDADVADASLAVTDSADPGGQLPFELVGISLFDDPALDDDLDAV